jgi:hypothetical protein
MQFIGRLHYIYSEPNISNEFLSKNGISYTDFFSYGFLMFQYFDSDYHFPLARFTNSRELNQISFNKALKLLSLDFKKLKESTIIKYDENSFVFHDSQHIITPIIELDGELICLFRNLLLRQFTRGAYYLTGIADNAQLSDCYGKRFEDYIGLSASPFSDGSKLDN